MARRKGQWSPEAKERYSKMMKERYGVNRDPLPSKIREAEYKLNTIDKPGKLEERNSEVSSTDRYVSKRAFDYDEGIRFEHGQIVELRGLPNDAKLISLGYVVVWKGQKAESQDCIKCGKEFGTTSGYSMHVAQHYQICSICKTSIAPEIWDKHQEAHQVLA